MDAGAETSEDVHDRRLKAWGYSFFDEVYFSSLRRLATRRRNRPAPSIGGSFRYILNVSVNGINRQYFALYHTIYDIYCIALHFVCFSLPEICGILKLLN